MIDIYVNPVLFGALLTIVVEILLVIIVTIIGIIKENDNAEHSDRHN